MVQGLESTVHLNIYLPMLLMEDSEVRSFEPSCATLAALIDHAVHEMATLITVLITADVSGHGKLWREGYKLEESMRSPFISQDLASRILRAGKSLNFLR